MREAVKHAWITIKNQHLLAKCTWYLLTKLIHITKPLSLEFPIMCKQSFTKTIHVIVICINTQINYFLWQLTCLWAHWWGPGNCCARSANWQEFGRMELRWDPLHGWKKELIWKKRRRQSVKMGVFCMHERIRAEAGKQAGMRMSNLVIILLGHWIDLQLRANRVISNSLYWFSKWLCQL